MRIVGLTNASVNYYTQIQSLRVHEIILKKIIITAVTHSFTTIHTEKCRHASIIVPFYDKTSFHCLAYLGLSVNYVYNRLAVI